MSGKTVGDQQRGLAEPASQRLGNARRRLDRPGRRPRAGWRPAARASRMREHRLKHPCARDTVRAGAGRELLGLSRAAACSANCAPGSSAANWRARTRPRGASTACWRRKPTGTRPTALDSESELPSQIETDSERQAQLSRPYFEVLIVDEMSASEEDALRRRVQHKRSLDDDFVFDVVVVPSFEDALIATLVNFNLQAVVIRHGFPFRSIYHNDMLRRFLDGHGRGHREDARVERGPLLGRQIAQLRPELDLYLVTDVNVEDIAGARRRGLQAHLLRRGRPHRALQLDHEGRGRAPPHAVLQRAARLRQAAHRRVPRAAAGARQVDHELQLDRRPGASSTA